jgi:putative transcriptional regulator
MATRAQKNAFLAQPRGLAGQLLIAMPSMAGSGFAQAVIYICAHNHEGAMGLVVNQPLASPDFDDVMQQLGAGTPPLARRLALVQGGPVEISRGFVLHSADWQGDGTLTLEDGLSLSANIDVLKTIAAGDGPAQAILALGYAGWGPGQLDREMQENAWLSAPGDSAIVFGDDHRAKWRGALNLLHIDPALLSSNAGHA